MNLGEYQASPAQSLVCPDKNVSLDVKDKGLTEIAATLTSQTGIRFTVAPGVPTSLKLTLHVDNVPVKQFLDTLSSTTGIIYIPSAKASSRLKYAEAHPDYWKQYQDLVASAVTDVLLTTAAAEGAMVWAGRVSLSLKGADPVEAATRIIRQLPGTTYVVMSLDDYLKLQQPERAKEIEKAVKRTPRTKVTLQTQDTDVRDALRRISEQGNVYIQSPIADQGRSGLRELPCYLIIPDVKVVDAKVMPGIGIGLMPSAPLTGY